MARILVLNGPNLNRLGTREPTVYGTTSLADIESLCRNSTRHEVDFRQTNHEGVLIDWIHESHGKAAGMELVREAVLIGRL